MRTNVNKSLRSIKRWNVFESGRYLTSGKYEPLFPFALTYSEAKFLAHRYFACYSNLCFVVLPYGCSF